MRYDKRSHMKRTNLFTHPIDVLFDTVVCLPIFNSSIALNSKPLSIIIRRGSPYRLKTFMKATLVTQADMTLRRNSCTANPVIMQVNVRIASVYSGSLFTSFPPLVWVRPGCQTSIDIIANGFSASVIARSLWLAVWLVLLAIPQYAHPRMAFQMSASVETAINFKVWDEQSKWTTDTKDEVVFYQNDLSVDEMKRFKEI